MAGLLEGKNPLPLTAPGTTQAAMLVDLAAVVVEGGGCKGNGLAEAGKLWGPTERLSIQDPVNSSQYKYVWLAANSGFKTDADLQKYVPPPSLPHPPKWDEPAWMSRGDTRGRSRGRKGCWLCNVARGVKERLRRRQLPQTWPCRDCPTRQSLCLQKLSVSRVSGRGGKVLVFLTAPTLLARYEKARLLKENIDRIRNKYTDLAKKESYKESQMGTAMYFIDKLALRAGHEKDEDEADTVGCCNLKVWRTAARRLPPLRGWGCRAVPPLLLTVDLLLPGPNQVENVMLEENNRIKFDFLGKDSIRYENTVQVEPRYYENVKKFKAKFGRRANYSAKKEDDQVGIFACFAEGFECWRGL